LANREKNLLVRSKICSSVRRDVGVAKWKPTAVTFILVVASSLGFLTLVGTEVATGTTVSGHISVDTTWDLAGSPYIVMNDVVVDPGVTLTVDPGVQVRFDPSDPGPPPNHDYLSIFVEGNLISKGQPGMHIEFTSDSLTPKTYDWWAIHVNSSGHVEMSYSEISYGAFGVVVYSSDNIIKDNIWTKNFQSVNLFQFSSRNYVANNTASNNTGAFVGMGESSGNFLINNSASGEWSTFFGYDSTDNLIAGNELKNTASAIEFFWDSRNNTIVGNTILNATDLAINLNGLGYDTIDSNTITLSGTGINLRGGENYTVSDNTLNGCGEGVHLDGWIRNSTISGNRLTQNSWAAMNVAFSSNNVITRNDIVSGSKYGLRLRNASNNLIYHNNFIDNAIQAFDDRVDNSWDNGYPSGGNYWSDYQGNDTFSGPNQDIPGSDGIGDTPYAVNPNGTDRYPFTEPTKGNLPPRNLYAHITGMNYENVTMTWNLSWNDGQRANDVTGYEIYRSSNYDKERTGYSLIGSTPNQTTQYVDSLSGEGDSNNYFYYVCAINGTGNSSCSSDQAAKFTCPLSEGSNLISIPLIQSDETIQTVLQTPSYDNAWSFDPINQEWKSYMKSKPYGQSLEHLNHTIGIWVNVTQDSNLTVAGVVPTSTTIDLQAGWNLVGFPSFDDNYTVADLKAAVAVERIEGFDGSAPPYFLRAMLDGDFLQAGFGCWIKVESPIVWIVNNT
jgi:parallel beta-helix repeat protein